MNENLEITKKILLFLHFRNVFRQLTVEETDEKIKKKEVVNSAQGGNLRQSYIIFFDKHFIIIWSEY